MSPIDQFFYGLGVCLIVYLVWHGTIKKRPDNGFLGLLPPRRRRRR